MRLNCVVAIAASTGLAVAPAPATAGGATSEDSVIATATSDPVEVGQTTPSDVVCEWGADEPHFGTGRYASGSYVYAYLDQLYWRIQPDTGQVWVQTWRTCRNETGAVSSSLGWRTVVAPDPRVIAEGLYDEVVEQVPVPEPALSPAGPGFVNLGMWLAVTEPAPISITATAGTVWATTTAELVATTFDMGDGTVVTCDGAGDPIPPSQLETLEASPVCGHTYTGVNGREPFPVTITSRWHVSWSGSGGVGGDLGELERTSTFDYRVLEIQTVGD